MRDHSNGAERGQTFQSNLGGRFNVGGRVSSYHMPVVGMHPSDRRGHIKGREAFKNGSQGIGQGTSDSCIEPSGGIFRQTSQWDGKDTFKDEEEISKDQEKAQGEDSFRENRGSSVIKSSLGGPMCWKNLCLCR